MEQALILGKISHRAPGDIIEKIKKIQGVNEANLMRALVIIGLSAYYYVYRFRNEPLE